MRSKLSTLVPSWRARIRRAALALPTSKELHSHFVPAHDMRGATAVATALVEHGLLVSVDDLDVVGMADPDAATLRYLDHIDALAPMPFVATTDLIVRSSELGLASNDAAGEAIALENVRVIATAGQLVGLRLWLTVDDPRDIGATLRIAAALRPTVPKLGVVLSVDLLRTEADVRELAAVPEALVCLIKRGEHGIMELSHPTRLENDRSFVRCMAAAIRGQTNTVVGTHDPRIVAIARDIAERSRRTVEVQFLYGVSLQLRRQLVSQGQPVRVLVPFGSNTDDYVAARVADYPADLFLHVRGMRRGVKEALTDYAPHR